MSMRRFLAGGLAVICTLNLAATSAMTEEAIMAERIATESAKANAYFERVFNEQVDRSPEFQGSLGIKRDNDKWDDRSDARQLEDFVRTVDQLGELQRSVRFDWLDPQTQMSFRLFVAQAEHEIEGWRWRHHGYPFSQIEGMHTEAPAFLINLHPIDNAADARAYIARLRALPAAFAPLRQRAIDAAARGMLPPKFVFPMLIDSCREILTGAPFEASDVKCALAADFEAKVAALPDLDDAARQQLLDEADAALRESVGPLYTGLIALFEAQEQRATEDDGVWKFPEGRDYYNFLLRSHTTTSLTAEEIHELGLREVARIHGEMIEIKDRMGFTGDLPAFLAYMREDPRFYYPQTEAGVAAYMQRANEIIDTMRGRLAEFFTVMPKAPMVVKEVEPFREKGAAAASYQEPSVDGTRPGIYYINSYDMRALAIWEMETLAHHEAIPGHHMQTAIAQEVTGLPQFRKHSWYTAYIEGWALYAEYFPKEYGFYPDPAMDFGRLSDELLRAVRLVVDTGIHAKRWPRQQVTDYFRANTASSEQELTSETDRYIMWPGQACSYKIGMMKIVELRELAKRELGPRFDLRAYHDLVLENGPLPLNLLEENVRSWITRRKG